MLCPGQVASCWSQLVKTHQSRATAMASGSSWLVDLVHVASTLRKEERVSLESMAVVEEVSVIVVGGSLLLHFL